MSDIYYMEQPQEYLNPEFVSDDNLPKSDIELAGPKPPVSFDNPKIKVTRGPNKRKPPIDERPPKRK